MKNNKLKNSAIQLDPNWVTGFTDAEGCFTVSIYSSDLKSKLKWRVIPCFQIELHIRDYHILEALQSYFNNVGNIYIKSKSANYQIRDINSIINIVIPHFENYPLFSQKYNDFIVFKKMIELIKNGDHLNNCGIEELISLKSILNRGISDNLNLVLKEKEKTVLIKPDLHIPNYIDNYWLAGFFSGDGCFFVNISKAKDCKKGSAIKLSITLTQHIKDKHLLEKIAKSLKCGSVYTHGKDTVVLKVSHFNEIIDVIIPFFNQYPIKGTKSLDFLDFTGVALLMKDGLHLTWQGFNEIKKIKSNMNKNRK